MSSEVSAWAFEQDTPEPIDKLVLIVMADGTPPDGWWNGSVERLAEICGMTIADVEKSIQSLVDSNVIGLTEHGYHLVG